MEFVSSIEIIRNIMPRYDGRSLEIKEKVAEWYH
jgi:hypothetical protein